jgi:hypothetical protein
VVIAVVTGHDRVVYGVVPAYVQVPTATGTVSQPIREFLGGYWWLVGQEAVKEVGK